VVQSKLRLTVGFDDDDALDEGLDGSLVDRVSAQMNVAKHVEPGDESQRDCRCQVSTMVSAGSQLRAAAMVLRSSASRGPISSARAVCLGAAARGGRLVPAMSSMQSNGSARIRIWATGSML